MPREIKSLNNPRTKSSWVLAVVCAPLGKMHRSGAMYVAYNSGLTFINTLGDDGFAITNGGPAKRFEHLVDPHPDQRS